MTENILTAAGVASGLGTRTIGQRVLYYPEVTSTNDIARAEARQGCTEGTTVIAGTQTAGRGRLKRTWLSPLGSLAVSIVLYPALAQLPALIMLASLGVAGAIRNVTGLSPAIKWPNDVLLGGKKVSGILIETEMRGRGVGYAVIGIGVNINLRVADFPEISPTATSLSDAGGHRVSFVDFTRCLLVELDRLYQALVSGGSLYEDWRDSLVTLGQPVRVTSGETVYEGTAESVSRDGHLLIRRPDGSLVNVVAGDASLRVDA